MISWTTWQWQQISWQKKSRGQIRGPSWRPFGNGPTAAKEREKAADGDTDITNRNCMDVGVESTRRRAAHRIESPCEYPSERYRCRCNFQGERDGPRLSAGYMLCTYPRYHDEGQSGTHVAFMVAFDGQLEEEMDPAVGVLVSMIIDDTRHCTNEHGYPSLVLRKGT